MKTHQTFAVTAFVLGCALPAFAQTPVPPAATPADSVPDIRAQVRTMERVFSSAIQNGVDQIGRKVNEAMPGLRIFAGLPHAHGYRVENFGWFFDVEVPDIQPAAVELYVELQPDARRGGGRAVSNSVPGTIKVPDSQPVPAVVKDPNGEYRLAIRDALIDAMLDYGQLPLKPTEELTVGARGADAPMPNMESTDSVTLILRITGSDLSLYKQSKITRAEAKARIKISEERR